MARLNLQKVLAMAALGACSCAASQTPPAQSAAPNEPAQGSTTTTLTNAEVPTTEVPAVESPPIPSPLVAPTPVEPETMAPTARWRDFYSSFDRWRRLRYTDRKTNMPPG